MHGQNRGNTVAVDAQSSLVGRIDALRRELELALSRFQAMKDSQPNLYPKVQPRFELESGRRRLELANLRVRVLAGSSLRGCWNDFNEIRDECRLLFHESLSFAHGVLARSCHLDGELCRVADALLDDLSAAAEIPWLRFTVLADEEYIGHAAQIIRLRYPMAGIWTLPMVAHEFGHFVGPEVRSDVKEGRYRGVENPFRDRLRQATRTNARSAAYLDEEFADIFATYVLGPAYACACLFLRFDPADAHEDPTSHPSYSKRVHLVLRTLTFLSSTDGAFSVYGDIIDNLDRRWRSSLAKTGQRQRLPPQTTVKLDEVLNSIFGLLTASLPAIRFRGLSKARALMAELPPRTYAPLRVDGVGVLEVMNAAWLVRADHLDDEELIAQVGDRAEDACVRIVNQRGGV